MKPFKLSQGKPVPILEITIKKLEPLAMIAALVHFFSFLSDTVGSCGVSPVTRVIGGENAKPGNWPWQVSKCFWFSNLYLKANIKSSVAGEECKTAVFNQ